MMSDFRNWDKIKNNYIGYYAALTPNANDSLVLFAGRDIPADEEEIKRTSRFICIPCYIMRGPDEGYYFTNVYYYYIVEFDDVYVQQGLVANKVMEIIDSHIFDYEITESEYRCFLEKRRLG